MLSARATVRNKVGFHIRAVTLVVETVMRFKSRITFAKDTRKRNGLSVLDLLMLEAIPGTTLTIEADGEDEGEALAAVIALFDRNFGEE